jgi:hypothetical protein
MVTVVVDARFDPLIATTVPPATDPDVGEIDAITGSG